ncbi:hypothetical protein [Streptomyces sp. BPTC-684]|uniref:hypothetical protein n=1 Tax=Streptomyces sp. BPTC-684 TaxID=3043734 RepID=UPI0024B0908C|nr:hypothetical protein [Streptomyces sp. BPTC-684]WHM40979.1 hypothetical protein QIY60_31665 [Streptomyces sp. BPTC-684]
MTAASPLATDLDGAPVRQLGDRATAQGCEQGEPQANAAASGIRQKLTTLQAQPAGQGGQAEGVESVLQLPPGGHRDTARVTQERVRQQERVPQQTTFTAAIGETASVRSTMSGS